MSSNKVHENIPDELRALRQWVCSAKDGKPINPHTGGNAMSNNPRSWGSFDDALAGCKKYGHDLPAFALTASDPYVIVDCDDKAANPAPVGLHNSIDADLASYSERSRGGRGLHVVVKGILPDGIKCVKTAHVEIYDRDKFITFTGDVVGKPRPISKRTAKIAKLVSAHAKPKSKIRLIDVPDRVADSDAVVLRRAAKQGGEQWAALHKGSWEALALGDGSQSAADYAYLALLWQASGNRAQVLQLFDRSPLHRADKATEYPARTLEAVVSAIGAATPGPATGDLYDSLVPMSDEVWAAAKTPHPHVFQEGHVGIFPVGEVTVIGSPGRTGKTTILVATATRHLQGETLGGLAPQTTGPIVVLSAEDSPTQFARKLKAATHFIKPKLQKQVEQGLIVPDFDSELLAPLRQLVSTHSGQPIVAPEVATMVDALRRFQEINGIGAVFIETASTWNAANEDNPSFRALIAAAKQIARALNVAVVLTHHVSQSSGINLSKLDLSVADLRGGTTFVDNSRQVALLVNLGSDDNPFPDDDARTVLRRMVAPRTASKVSALVFLNSSQGDDVPPLFFEWASSEYGPACIEITPPSAIQGRKWYALREMVKAVRPLKAESDRAAKVEEVVNIVNIMHTLRKAGGNPPTARSVSKHAGHGDSWATAALKEAVKKGLLTCSKEAVPRSSKKVDVYRPIRPHGAPHSDPE